MISAAAAPRLRSYECQVRGTDWLAVIHATTRAKARYLYLLDLRESWPDLTFADIIVHGCGAPKTTDEFRRTAEYRGVPFAQIGMAIEVAGDCGVIVGNNSSANFDVLFHTGLRAGLVLNCHPNWMTKYFDRGGNLLASFENDRRPKPAHA